MQTVCDKEENARQGQLRLLDGNPSLPQSHASIYIAWGVGEDVGGCGVTAQRPCRTLQYAIDGASDGSTLFVAPGRSCLKFRGNTKGMKRAMRRQ
jgi:hypothetical protein